MGISQFTAGQEITALELNQLPVVVSYLATGSGGTSSAGEATIGTFSIPAGDPSFPGGYQWFVHGIAAEASSPSLTIRMRLNSLSGAIIASAAATFNTPPGIFQIEGFMMFEGIGSSGTYGSLGKVWQNFTGSTTITGFQQEAIAINTTNSNTLLVTAQYGASNASNLATTKGGALYRL